MSLVSSWRTALRIARREAKRTKGRSALVIAMIALPVIALSGFASAYDMFELTPAENAERTMGQFDALISWPTHEPIEQLPDAGSGYWSSTQGGGKEEPKPGTAAELRAILPAGSQVVPVRHGLLVMKTTAGIGQIDAVSTDAGNPLLAGYLSIVEGRAPQTASEVALTKQAAARLGADLDDAVSSADGKTSYRVVGLVEFPWSLAERMLFADTGAQAPDGLGRGPESWFVKTSAPLDWAAVRQLNQHGIVVTSREVMLNPPPARQVPQPAVPVNTEELTFTVLIAGLALLEIVLMAGPAFAISARRRQRQLALVAANGGTPAHVRRIVLADGVVLGAAGAVVGATIGIAVAFLARPLAEELLFGRRAGGYRVFPEALLAIAALAVVTGLLAALVPAFITARQNVVQALAGRRGATRSRKRWLALGLAAVALGTAIVVYATAPVNVNLMLAGMVIGELGLVLCTPAMVGLIARAGRILPLAPRIALRDAARNRAAAAPAISAVMAAVAGSVALGLIITSKAARDADNYQLSAPVGYLTVYLPEQLQSPEKGAPPAPTPAQIESILRQALPITEVRQLDAVGCAAGVTDHWCMLESVIAPSKRCPYIEISQQRQLTEADIAAARADHRCDDVLSGAGSRGAFIDDGSGLATITGATGDDLAAAMATLRAGGVVVPDEKYLEGDHTLLRVINVDQTKQYDTDPAATAPTRSFPAYHLKTGTLAMTIVAPSVAQSVGMTGHSGIMIGATSRVPTRAEEDKVNELLQQVYSYAQLERGAPDNTPPELWALMAAAAVIALAAAAVGTALAAADGRSDLSTLAAVGASPRMRRGLSLSQSAVIAGLGSALGAAAGLGAAVAIITAINVQYLAAWPATLWPIQIPWLSLVVALGVVPAIAMLGAGVLTRSRLPIERRL